MSRDIPDEIWALGEARAAARSAGDYAEADRLRTEIEAAGWKIADNGVRFRLTRANPPDVEIGGRTRYGSSASVPSRLEEPASAAATIVLRATDWRADVERAVVALRATSAAATQLVVVGDSPSAEQAAALESLEAEGRDDLEVVWTAARLGHAAALNAGIRRAVSDVVILLDASVEPRGDVVSPLIAALDDPTVAVAGGFGVVSRDLRTFEAAPAGDVDAVEGYVQAFRRADYAERGPLDEHFRFYRNLDLWWSLALRDEGEDAAPRRALAVDLPVESHEHRGWAELPDQERDRLSKRNFYRIIDRFGWRRDLLLRPASRNERAGATRRG